MTLPVQINGKLVGALQMDSGATDEQIQNAVVKVVIVPGVLVNLVVPAPEPLPQVPDLPPP
jgi:hypothetical protein